MRALAEHPSIIVFRVGSCYCAVSVTDVDSVVVPQPLTILPQQPNWVKGIFKFRDHPIGVISLFHKFGIKEPKSSSEGTYLVVYSNTGMTALWVDEIFDISSSYKEHAGSPKIKGTESFYQQVVEWEEKLVFFCDARKLIAMDVALDENVGRELENISIVNENNSNENSKVDENAAINQEVVGENSASANISVRSIDEELQNDAFTNAIDTLNQEPDVAKNTDANLQHIDNNLEEINPLFEQTNVNEIVSEQTDDSNKPLYDERITDASATYSKELSSETFVLPTNEESVGIDENYRNVDEPVDALKQNENATEGESTAIVVNESKESISCSAVPLEGESNSNDEATQDNVTVISECTETTRLEHDLSFRSNDEETNSAEKSVGCEERYISPSEFYKNEEISSTRGELEPSESEVNDSVDYANVENKTNTHFESQSILETNREDSSFEKLIAEEFELKSIGNDSDYSSTEKAQIGAYSAPEVKDKQEKLYVNIDKKSVEFVSDISHESDNRSFDRRRNDINVRESENFRIEINPGNEAIRKKIFYSVLILSVIGLSILFGFINNQPKKHVVVEKALILEGKTSENLSDVVTADINNSRETSDEQSANENKVIVEDKKISVSNNTSTLVKESDTVSTVEVNLAEQWAEIKKNSEIGRNVVINNSKTEKVTTSGDPNESVKKRKVNDTKKITHSVKKGETLWHLSDQYLNDPYKFEEIAEKNKIRDPDLIFPNEKIEIPTQKSRN